MVTKNNDTKAITCGFEYCTLDATQDFQDLPIGEYEYNPATKTYQILNVIDVRRVGYCAQHGEK